MIKYILPFSIKRRKKSIKWRKKVDLNFDENGVAPTWRLSQLTNDELDEVIRILSERMQNSLEMVVESRVAEALSLLTDKDIRERDTVTIQMDMVFVWMDILEIVGGYRRREKENE